MSCLVHSGLCDPVVKVLSCEVSTVQRKLLAKACLPSVSFWCSCFKAPKDFHFVCYLHRFFVVFGKSLLETACHYQVSTFVQLLEGNNSVCSWSVHNWHVFRMTWVSLIG